MLCLKSVGAAAMVFSVTDANEGARRWVCRHYGSLYGRLIGIKVPREQILNVDD